MGMLDPTDERFISGIYNYCDRWCERCVMTDRCYLYAQEQADREDYLAQGKDPDTWEATMEMVHHSFERALAMLKQMAEEQGLDLEVPAEEGPRMRFDPQDHPLFQRAEAFCDRVWNFLPRLRDVLEAERKALLDRVEVTPSAEEEVRTLAEIADAYEVISWFHPQVAAKVYRALATLEDEWDGEPDLKEMAQSDANGSAKVAYLGLARLMAAFQTLYAWDEGLQDDVLPLLAEAERLRRHLDAEFPGHREFKRPGFDD